MLIFFNTKSATVGNTANLLVFSINQVNAAADACNLSSAPALLGLFLITTLTTYKTYFQLSIVPPKAKNTIFPIFLPI